MTPPNHNLNKHWPITSKVQWYLSGGIITRDTLTRIILTNIAYLLITNQSSYQKWWQPSVSQDCLNVVIVSKFFELLVRTNWIHNSTLGHLIILPISYMVWYQQRMARCLIWIFVYRSIEGQRQTETDRMTQREIAVIQSTMNLKCSYSINNIYMVSGALRCCDHIVNTWRYIWYIRHILPGFFSPVPSQFRDKTKPKWQLIAKYVHISWHVLYIHFGFSCLYKYIHFFISMLHQYFMQFPNFDFPITI